MHSCVLFFLRSNGSLNYMELNYFFVTEGVCLLNSTNGIFNNQG